jgi:hypothetical protein
LYLSGSVADPSAKAVRPGSLMTWWAVDLAALNGAMVLVHDAGLAVNEAALAG